MLRTTEKLALVFILMFAVISNAEAAAQKRQVNAKRPAAKPSQNQDTIYVQKVNAFLKDPRWIPGTEYNSSQKPKLSKYRCVGCCAFTADFVHYVFGKGTPRTGTLFNSPSQIKAGDIVIFHKPQHWIVVLARRGNNLETLEGNWMGKVVRSKDAYTLNGNTIMRNGKQFRTFLQGYHYR